MAKACQLFSGSSGNSIFIGNNSGGVLVDIGVSAKRCEYALNRLGVSPESSTEITLQVFVFLLQDIKFLFLHHLKRLKKWEERRL